MGGPRPRPGEATAESRRSIAVPELVEAARRGEVRALARLLTVLEGEWEEGAGEAMRLLTPHARQAHVIGVTGPPGAGKSTLVDRLIAALLDGGSDESQPGTPRAPRPARSPQPRRRRDRIAVLAFDPSSPFTGGALLGDRIRMAERALDPRVFIRSVANRAHAGGLSLTAARLVTALDAAGYGTILLETVGAGQSEVEVAALADTVLVVLAPGFGDEIQALKAGILETADLFVVNKADLPGADRVAMTLRGEAGASGMSPEDPTAARAFAPAAMNPLETLAPRLQARSLPSSHCLAPVFLVSATTGAGIPQLAAALAGRAADREGEERKARRRLQGRERLREAVREALWRWFRRERGEALAAITQRMEAGELDPESAARLLVGEELHRGKPDP